MIKNKCIKIKKNKCKKKFDAWKKNLNKIKKLKVILYFFSNFLT